MQQPLIKAFIIHLERATERRAQVAELISQLPVDAEIITAIDAKQLSDADIAQVYRPRLHKPYYPFQLNRNEIACFLSHRKTWQAIIDQELDAALILEDDAAFSAACAALTHSGFIRLPFRPNRENGPIILNNQQVNIIRPSPVGLGTIGQIITRQAAQILLDKTATFDRPVDTFKQMNWITGLQPLAAVPSGVTEISASLGGSTLKQARSLGHKLHREVMRPIYRSQVAAYSRKKTN